MKTEHSKIEYVRLTMEEYQFLIDENKNLHDKIILLNKLIETLPECIHKNSCQENICTWSCPHHPINKTYLSIQ